MFHLMLQNYFGKYLKSFKCSNVTMLPAISASRRFVTIQNSKISTSMVKGICVDLISKNGGTLVTL